MSRAPERVPRGRRWLDQLSRDLRFGWRLLRRSPGFTALAVLMLAVGIGANAAIFSVVDAVLLRPLPYADPQDLVWMFCRRVDRAKAPFSIADFEDYQRQGRGLVAVAAFDPWGANLTGAGVAARIQGVQISGNFLDTLGVRPFLGRGVEPADDLPEAQPTVVLTYGFWQRQFGADRGVIGRTMLLNGRRYVVTGILPRGFFFPQRNAEIASAARLGSDPRRADRGDRFLRVVGRLRRGTSAARAETELTALAERLRRLYPATNDKNVGVRAFPMDQELVGDLRFALRILGGAVGMLLLLACANLGHLLLMRFSARRHEMAVRLALGATPGGLARQMLVESCLVAGAGAALGVLLARGGIPLLLRLSPQRLPDAGAIGVDTRLLLFIAAIGVMAVMVFGLWPAWRASRSQPREAIKAPGSQAGGASSDATLRQALIALETGLAVVLLTGAGLFAKSFARLAQVNPGFTAGGAVVMRVSLPPQRYQAPPAVTAFQQRLAEMLKALPGVQAVGVTSSLPLSGTWAADDFTIVGRPALKAAETPSAQYRVVDPGYFEAMGIPLLSGRAFREDDRLESRPVVIVNRTMADRFWPRSGGGSVSSASLWARAPGAGGEDSGASPKGRQWTLTRYPHASPLGEHLKLGGYSPAGGDPEIVGVVGDVKHLALDEEATFDVYVPLRQVSMGYLPYLVNGTWWVVRGKSRLDSLAGPMRDAVQAADVEVATAGAMPLERFVADAAALRRFNAWLGGAFGGAALLLAAFGIYGVVASGVAQRRREIGLRIAIGARPAGILRLVVAQGMAVALAGMAGGELAALLLARWAARLLFGIGAADPATLCQAAGILLGAALLACIVPARRAAAVDPVVALRSE